MGDNRSSERFPPINTYKISIRAMLLYTFLIPVISIYNVIVDSITVIILLIKPHFKG